jgi:DNA-binding NtrC family response regulator
MAKDGRGWRFTEFPYMLRKMPDELKFTILRCVEESRGHMGHTAEALGISRRVLYGYVDKLDILSNVQEIKDKFADQRRSERLARRNIRARTYGVARGSVPEAEISRLARTKPNEARQMLLWAFSDSGADAAETAKHLGIQASVFYRLTQELGLESEFQRARGGFALRRREDALARGLAPERSRHSM